MIRSLNEISGMVAKAARGAGLSVGVAEDLGEALPVCCPSGEVTPALESLADHLAAPDRLMRLIAALDAVEAEGMPVAANVPTDPALVALIRQRGTVGWVETPDGITLRPAETVTMPRPAPQAVDPELWARLDRYAARTYVPASEASRIAGAGAGLSDND